MNDEYTQEDKEKLMVLRKAITGLEGVAIPYNIIAGQINPLNEWLKELLE